MLVKYENHQFFYRKATSSLEFDKKYIKIGYLGQELHAKSAKISHVIISIATSCVRVLRSADQITALQKSSQISLQISQNSLASNLFD